MTSVLQSIAAAVTGKESVSNDSNEEDKTPAEKIKEKALEEERKEVADGSNGPTSTNTTNGISTNPEEAHASDTKDNMSIEANSANNTVNGADDNASMLPLGKGDYTEPAMGAQNTNTTNTGATSSVNTDNNTSTGPSYAEIQIAGQTSVTRAEVDSAKQAIIRAVANCKITREVVFSDTDTGTLEGSEEIKRVLSGYKGIDQALEEMNRYIPTHVRNSSDLGVKEGDRIRKEQQDAAKALEPTGFNTTESNWNKDIVNPNEKITEEQALSEAPAGNVGDSTSNTGLTDIQKEELNRVPDADANPSTVTADTDSKNDPLEGVSLQDMQPEAEHGVTLGAGIIPGLPASTTHSTAEAANAAGLAHAFATSSRDDDNAKHTLTEDSALSDTDNKSFAAAPATETLSSTHGESHTTPEQAPSGTNNKDEAAILASTGLAPIGKGEAADDAAVPASTSDVASIDKGKGRAEEESNTPVDTTLASPPKSPVQGERLADRLKREVEERARRGQLGVFNKPLNSTASQANLASSTAAKEPEASTASKDGPASSSAFTEEFGAGETGLTASSPTTAGAGTSSTKPPSTRARAGSMSSQTSTGEKKGLLGLFRRRSKRQSVSDGSTGGRRASNDLSRTVSKDTVSSPTTATSSAVPPAPEKPVETVDTTTPAVKDDSDTGNKTAGIAALGVGAGAVTAATAVPDTAKDEPEVVDKSTTTAEPSTSEHKVEDVAPANATDQSTQTVHEPAAALGTAVEPVVYAEETAPLTSTDGGVADESTTALPHKEDSGDMLGPAAVAAVTPHQEKDEPEHIEKQNSGDMTGPAALAIAAGEKATADTNKNHEVNPFKTEAAPITASAVETPRSPTHADKSTSTTAEKGTSTEAEPALAPAVIPAPPATAVHTTDDDVPLYSKEKSTSPGLERKSSKSGGFFGLFRRRSSRRSSSGPPQRSVSSDVGKPTPVVATAATLPTENHVTSETEKEAANESAVADEPLEEAETPLVGTVDADDADATGSGLARTDTDKIIAEEAEAYSEATIHSYGALNVDELETVEEEMERGPEETVAEPGSFIDHDEDHEEDEERETIRSDGEHDAVAAHTGDSAHHDGARAHSVRTTSEVGPSSLLEHNHPHPLLVPVPVVETPPATAATPAERLLQGKSERRQSRGSGFFSLFRSKSRKDKEHEKSPQHDEYSTIVKNMGVVPRSKSENKDMAVAVGTGGLERSKSRTTTVAHSTVNDESIHHHEDGHDEEEEEQEYLEAEEEIPDNRSITEIAASIPLPAPVYTDKTRAKHERLRKKREHEEALERERIRKENEILNKRERIMNAYTGKQDFTKVPKPARTKAFGRAHERKDLDGIQFVKKSDKKAAKKDDVLTKTTSRGSSIDEPSSPSHPASGGFAGSFPVDKSTSRVSQRTQATSGPDTEPGSPSSPVMVSPIVKLTRRVSAIANKREKSVEPVPA